jgi:VanZ family protein
MGVIYNLSAQPAVESAALSRGVTEVVLDAVEKVVPSTSMSVESLNHFIRKEAHFFAYLILGLLVSHSFSRNGLHGIEKIRHTLVICLLYAVSDEAHQMLVPGRGPSLVDVSIDGMGAMAGLVFYYVMHLPFKRKVRYEGIDN